jgi:hypothetical protein
MYVRLRQDKMGLAQQQFSSGGSYPNARNKRRIGFAVIYTELVGTYEVPHTPRTYVGLAQFRLSFSLFVSFPSCDCFLSFLQVIPLAPWLVAFLH